MIAVRSSGVIPLRRQPPGIAEGRSISVGKRFGGFTIEANALDIDGHPYVRAATEEWAHPDGLFSAIPTGHYLYVWASTWGTVTLRDPSGGLHELAPGWYPWPDDEAPVQVTLL